MKSNTTNAARLIAAFLAGQAVMFGMVAFFRATPVGAQTTSQPPTTGEPGVVTARTMIIRDTPTGPGIQLSAVGAGGGPSVSFFDDTGAARMQLSVDGKGKPTVVLRNKAGAIAIGIGLQNDAPIVAVRAADGTMTTLPLPGDHSAKP